MNYNTVGFGIFAARYMKKIKYIIFVRLNE